MFSPGVSCNKNKVKGVAYRGHDILFSVIFDITCTGAGIKSYNKKYFCKSVQKKNSVPKGVFRRCVLNAELLEGVLGVCVSSAGKKLKVYTVYTQEVCCVCVFSRQKKIGVCTHFAKTHTHFVHTAALV